MEWRSYILFAGGSAGYQNAQSQRRY